MKIFAAVVGIIALALLVDMGIAWLLMTIWNNVIVGMFNTPVFAFWNMFFVVIGLNVLASMFRGSTSKSK